MCLMDSSLSLGTRSYIKIEQNCVFFVKSSHDLFIVSELGQF